MTQDLLKLVTAGSVDDGKSTLVGRLLYDTKSVLADQIDAVLRTSAERGLADPDLSLLVDGLRAEREQGITIDVAYRYFATPERTFVLADTPGHVQYTRNTVTGASTADHAVLLTDARHGVLPQTTRHLTVMALLGVTSITLAVNKMDLVDFREEVYREIRDEFLALAAALGYPAASVGSVPLSALAGDNVVKRSDRTPWYDGPTLLERLETVPSGEQVSGLGLRMPVQYVLRPVDGGRRHYAGRIAAGRVGAGDEIRVLPAGRTAVVERIETPDGPVSEAGPGDTVGLVLGDEIDVCRGDMLAASADGPRLTDDLDATVCWLSDVALRGGDRVLIKHGTRVALAEVTDVLARFDEQQMTVDADGPDELRLNDIGRARLRVADPIPIDDYTDCRLTGSFLIIDREDGNTLGAGLLGDPLASFAGTAR